MIGGAVEDESVVGGAVEGESVVGGAVECESVVGGADVWESVEVGDSNVGGAVDVTVKGVAFNCTSVVTGRSVEWVQTSIEFFLITVQYLVLQTKCYIE